MDKFTKMHVFSRVVELGTLTAVAKEMKLSPMMISKYLAQLEASLGVALLHRTTRNLCLTAAGEAYFERSKALLSELADLEAAITQLGEQVQGQIKISAPIDFGGIYMVPAIQRYQQRYPEVKVLMSLDNKPPNLRLGHFDLSLLVSDTLDPGVVARKIAETELCTYASPRYLHAYGHPACIEELPNHRCLHYVDTPHGDYWVFDVNGSIKKIKSDWILASNNGRALCQAAALGMGIVQVPRLSVAPYLESGELVEILREYRRSAVAIYATYLQRRFYPAKLTTFIDFLLEYFQDSLAMR